MFTLVPGLVCTWLVDVPSAHAPRRNEYRRLLTAIQTYDPVYNNWVERSDCVPSGAGSASIVRCRQRSRP